jgi:hypothetical protein
VLAWEREAQRVRDECAAMTQRAEDYERRANEIRASAD